MRCEKCAQMICRIVRKWRNQSAQRIYWSAQMIHITILSPNITLYHLVSSADNICKQFGPRSGPTEHWAWSGSKPFDTQIVFLKEFLEKLDFEKKISRRQKKREKFPSGQPVNSNKPCFPLHWCYIQVTVAKIYYAGNQFHDSQMGCQTQTHSCSEN